MGDVSKTERVDSFSARVKGRWKHISHMIPSENREGRKYNVRAVSSDTCKQARQAGGW